MIKPYERILAQRGHQRTPDMSEEGVYHAYVDSGGHPQVSFVLFTRDEAMHLFQYSHFDNAEWKKIGDQEFMYFTHRGKAVTIRGSNLSEIIMALQEYRVKSIHEYDGTLSYYEDRPFIDRVSIINMNTPPNYEDLVD